MNSSILDNENVVIDLISESEDEGSNIERNNQNVAMNNKRKDMAGIQNFVTSTELLVIKEKDACIIDLETNSTLSCVLINPNYEEWKNGAKLKEYQESETKNIYAHSNSNTVYDKRKDGAKLKVYQKSEIKNLYAHSNSNTVSDKRKDILLDSSKCKSPVTSCYAIQSPASTSKKRTCGENDDVSKRIKTDVPQFLLPDVYSPNDLAELALDIKRLKEVEGWFDNAFSENNYSTMYQMRSRRLLVLSGPPGSSKTSVIKLLAKKRNLHVIEWENPQTFSRDYSDEYVPVMAPFESFLSYNGRNPHKQCILNKNDSQIIIVEDLPCLINAEAKKQFHQAIRVHIKHSRTIFPLVLIISEARSFEDFDEYVGKDSFQTLNWRSILPNDIISSDQCTIIEFLSINNTHMVKGLELFINKVYTNDRNKKEVALQLYPHLINQCHGDIRLAINTLQFLMVESPEKFIKNYSGARTNSQKKFTKGSHVTRKRRVTNSKRLIELKTNLDPALWTLFDSVTRNELITDPFKAIGRILYNKRITDSDDEIQKGIWQKINSLQKELIHPRDIRERMPLMYSPESTLDNMSIEYHTYLCMLRHYYSHFYGNILECQFASECLSDAELLMNNQDFKVGIKLTPTAAILASRGLLFAHIQFFDKDKIPLFTRLPSTKDFREHISNERFENEGRFAQYFREKPIARLTSDDTLKTEIAPLMGKMVDSLRMDELQKQFLKKVISYDKNW